MTISDGYYSVRNAANNLHLSVEGASTAQYAALVTSTASDGNEQVMKVVSENGNSVLYPVHTIGVSQGTTLDDPDYRLGLWSGMQYWQPAPIPTANPAGSRVVSSNTWSQDTMPQERDARELWLVVDSGLTILVNGVSYPQYLIKSAFEGTEVVDCYLTPPLVGSFGSYACTVQRLSTTGSAGSLYQRWAMVPTVPYDGDLPVPFLGLPSVTGSTHMNLGQTSASPIMFDTDVGALWPTWITREPSNHQVRWRRRDRIGYGQSIGEWTNWVAWGGDGSNDGWGANPTAATSGIVNVSQNYLATGSGVTIDFTDDIDLTEVEWNIRTIDSDKPAAGGVYSFTSIAVKKFKITSAECFRLPTGVYITFTTSYPDFAVASASAVGTNGDFSKASSTGECSVMVGNSKFSSIPSIGDRISISLTATTLDGYSASWDGEVEVTMGGSYGDAPTVVCTINGTIATIQADAPDGMTISGAWLVVPRGHGDRYVDLGGLDAPGGISIVRQTWTVPPPLGVPWSVLITTSDGNRWGFDATLRDAIIEEPPTYHVTSQNCKRDLSVALKKDAPGPTFAPTYTRSRTETETYSRERPVYGYSDVTKAQWTLTGDLLAGEENDDVDWFAHDSHVYFRSPHGFWAQCAVNSVRIDLSATQSQEVQLNLSEEVW